MSEKNPCINCITYAICQARVVDGLHLSIPYPWRGSILIAYYIRLDERCSLIKNYITDLVEKANTIDPSQPYTTYKKVKLREKMIYQVMEESFNLVKQ